MVTAINFVSSKVHSVNLEEVEDISGLDAVFNIDYTPAFSPEDDKSFIIKFNITLISIEDPAPFKMLLEYYGKFTTDEPITDEFKESPFTRVNAPAIVYPYLRSFVSTLTLNAGLTSPILNTFNFQQFYNQQLDKKKKES